MTKGYSTSFSQLYPPSALYTFAILFPLKMEKFFLNLNLGNWRTVKQKANEQVKFWDRTFSSTLKNDDEELALPYPLENRRNTELHHM